MGGTDRKAWPRNTGRAWLWSAYPVVVSEGPQWAFRSAPASRHHGAWAHLGATPVPRRPTPKGLTPGGHLQVTLPGTGDRVPPGQGTSSALQGCKFQAKTSAFRSLATGCLRRRATNSPVPKLAVTSCKCLLTWQQQH